ncbi:MAG: hypothetical protein K0R84_1195 [Clostridia bacterium]|jgi:predicted nucleotide-binding protein (sugar kinase/HSP70/actin superfamily)|nr:hypothetical protein [Clostridia bacterium]
MIVGIPKGLLYCRYQSFLDTFFYELGAEIITSPDTNKEILNAGVKYCIDEACLPVKIYHGHVASIKDKCDMIAIPRIMQLREREFICPKFCGLPEMVVSSIPDMPRTTMAPIYAMSKDRLYAWAKKTGSMVTHDTGRIKRALDSAIHEQQRFKGGIKDEGFRLNIALTGHPYNLYDSFINMNIVKKLNKLGVGVITEEYADESIIDDQVKKLYKKPFWSFARNSYGFAVHSAQSKAVDGIIYISSFACGIDSVVIELIKDKTDDFPFMVIKLDEHTGEAGLDTRVEAFVDMLERTR